MTQAFNLSQLANKVNTSGQVDVSTGLTGTISTSNLPTIPINKGGTNNAALGVSAGGVVYTDGSALQNVGAGTSGFYLKSNGASAPTWAAVSGGPVISAGNFGNRITESSVTSFNTSMVKLYEARISNTGIQRIKWNHYTKAGYGLTTYTQVWKNGVNQAGSFGSNAQSFPGTEQSYDGSFATGDLVQIYGAAYAGDVGVIAAYIFSGTADGQAFSGSTFR
jgi:hypothetical protein